jgi:hypothetical protein
MKAVILAGVGAVTRAVGVAFAQGLPASVWQWADRRRLREIDPHFARDIGVAPGWDRAPEGFVVDPRPLWGIGLTPQPMEHITPRQSRS